MKNRSLAIGAVLGAVSIMSLVGQNSASAAMDLQTLGRSDPSTITQFNVYLPLTNRAALDKLLNDQTDTTSPNYHKWLTPAQFKTQFGPNPADVATVKAALAARGFTVIAENTQSVTVQGTVSAVEAAFSAHLQTVQTTKGNVKIAAAEGHLTVPAELAAVGAMVPAFTTLEEKHVHSVKASASMQNASPLFRFSSQKPFSFYYPNDLNEAYDLPSFQTLLTPLGSTTPAQIAGVGAHIGIVIDSVIQNSDLYNTFNSIVPLGGTVTLTQAYSANSNLKIPQVRVRAVDGGSGPFNLNGDAFEASLDTQMSLGTAPGAEETLYNIPDLSDSSIIDGYAAVDEDNHVDVVSSSFGGCELYYTPAYNFGSDFTFILGIYHSLFQQGNAQGITFLASSGDNGALECVTPQFFDYGVPGTSFVAGVSIPAADPNVTAVGGTNLSTTATPGENDATYQTENANYDPRYPAVFFNGVGLVSVDKNTWGSGGGFSQIFAKPAYQHLVRTGSDTARAVPDVSLMMGGCPGDANLQFQDCTQLPRSASFVWVGGGLYLLIGTSSSSPELAGVLALGVELNGGRLGNVNPAIYARAALQTAKGGINAPPAFQFFHRTVFGNNRLYSVHPGQDYSEVLGTGTLDVRNFLGLTTLAAPAGTPNTPSNP